MERIRAASENILWPTRNPSRQLTQLEQVLWNQVVLSQMLRDVAELIEQQRKPLVHLLDCHIVANNQIYTLLCTGQLFNANVDNRQTTLSRNDVTCPDCLQKII